MMQLNRARRGTSAVTGLRHKSLREAQANASTKRQGSEAMTKYPMLDFRLDETDWRDRTNPAGDPYQTARLFSDADTGVMATRG